MKLTSKEVEELVLNAEVDRITGEDRKWSKTIESIVQIGDGKFYSVVWNQGLEKNGSQSNMFYDQEAIEVCLSKEEKLVVIRNWIPVGELDNHASTVIDKLINNVDGSKPSNSDKYTLVKKEKVKEKTFRVIIEADSNDADYITTDETYNEKEFNEVIDELIDLKNNYGGRHQLEDFENDWLTIPRSEWGRCHSLTGLEVTCEDIDGTVYDVEF